MKTMGKNKVIDANINNRKNNLKDKLTNINGQSVAELAAAKYFWEAEVRDDELDFQGIVSNVNYLLYMMHARTKHFRKLGIDVNEMHESGYDFVLVRTDISFKASLKSGDEFIVTSLCKPYGKIRFIFEQEVIRKSDNKIVATATNTITCLSVVTRRPKIPAVLQQLLAI